MTWEPIINEETDTVIVQADYGTRGYAGRSFGIARLAFNVNHHLMRYEWQTSYLGSEIPLDAELLELRNRWE